jgi:rhodanese-related sulfurtransferase
VHIPLATVPVRMAELDRGQRHYIVCQAGGRSAQACMFLAAQGFDVVNVAGGTGDWIAAGLPVVMGD